MTLTQQKRKILYWLANAGILILSLFLQTTPGLFTFWGCKPVWVFSCCFVLACFETIVPAAVFGVVGGLLCDYSAGRLSGYFSLFTMLLCVGLVFLFLYFVRRNWYTVTLFAGIAVLCIEWIDYLFMYLLPDYSHVGQIFVFRTIPIVGLTVCTLPLYYFIMKKLKQFVLGKEDEE